MLAALVAHNPAFEPNGGAGRNGSAIVHFEVAGHGGKAARADRLAHGLIEERCDDSAVQESGVAFEAIGDADGANHCAVIGEEEFKLQAVFIGFSATEAAILGRMGQGSEIVEMRLHAGDASTRGGKRS